MPPSSSAHRPSIIDSAARHDVQIPDSARRAVRGGITGNYVDQFDIFLPVIALAPAAATLYGSSDLARNTALVFVATLLGRPLGAAIFGPIADRLGRTTTTQVTIAGVAVSTLLIAMVPGSATLGGLTFALILSLRFVGGIFLGGEYTAAVPLAMEWSAPRRRGLVSGLIMSMSPWANATIALITLVLLGVLGPVDYAEWGWRVPFLLGSIMAFGMFAYYRRNISDAPVWKTATRRRSPLTELLLGVHRRQLVQVFVLMSGLWLFTNMAIPVLTARLTAVGRSAADVPVVMFVGTVVSALAMVLTGHLSTRLGRRRFFVRFGLTAIVAAPAGYALVAGAAAAAHPLPVVALAVAVLQVVTVSVYGPIGAYLTERFPTAVRSSGYGVAYSVSIVLPALYPFYLPALQAWLGADRAVWLLLALGGICVAGGALLGPEVDVEGPLP